MGIRTGLPRPPVLFGKHSLLNSMSALVIAKKEFKDYMSSKLFWTIYFIFALTILISAYQGAYDYSEEVKKYEEELRKAEEGQNIFRISRPEPNILRAFIRLTNYIAFIGAILAIIVGFNAISGEKEKNTLQILLSYPTYRESIINGKFLGRLAVLTFACALTLLAGIGLTVGLTNPVITDEDIMRLLTFILVSLLYMSSFMIIAILLSVIYKDSVLSLSTSMILWVSSVFLLLPISKLIATLVYPIPKSMILTGEEEKSLVRDIIANHYSLMDTISTISPSYSFQKLGRYILDPYSRAITFQMPIQTEPLPLAESLLLAWPSIVVLLSCSPS